MKKQLLFFIGLLSLNSSFSQVNFQWGHGSSGIKTERSYAVKSDALGNVYMCGIFQDTLDFDPGPATFSLATFAGGSTSGFVCKYDPTGNLLWAEQFYGGSFNNYLDVDASGNVVIIGYFINSVDFDPGPGTYPLTATTLNTYVCKLNSSGNLVWVKVLGAPSSPDLTAPKKMEIDAVGDILITGWINGTTDFDPGPGTYTLSSNGAEDVFICKLNSAGNFMWAKTFGSTSQEIAVDIASDPVNKNVYVTGYFNSTTVDFDPGPGVNNINLAGGNDEFIIGLNSTGNFLWANSIGGKQADQGVGIAVDNAGDVITSGIFKDTCDFDPGAGVFTMTAPYYAGNYVRKLSASGNFIWAKCVAGTSFSTLMDCGPLTVDASGNIYFTGTYSGSLDLDPGPGVATFTTPGFYPDMFVGRLDPAGSFNYAFAFGGTNSEFLTDISVDAAKNIYTNGSFYIDCDLDPGTGVYNIVSPSSAEDFFIQKLSQSPTAVDELILKNGISIFPNPVQSYVNVKLNSSSKVSIYDMFSGKLSSVFLNPGINSIDMSRYASGIYILEIGGLKYKIIKIE